MPDEISAPIDRRRLVTRHNPTVRQPTPLSPLTVGNGEFAFTADITGLQTFPGFYETGGDPALPGVIPLGTQAQWGWHSFPNLHGFHQEQAFRYYDTYGRPAPYPVSPSPHGPAAAWSARDPAQPDRRVDPVAVDWLRANPHRLDLGRLGLVLRHVDGAPVALPELGDPHQTLDLWTGTLISRFSVDGEPVLVHTWVHPALDLVAVRVESLLLASGRISLSLAFPYGSATHTGSGGDWNAPERHQTQPSQHGPRRADLLRTLDADRYHVAVAWSPEGALQEVGPHSFVVMPGAGQKAIECAVAFSQGPLGDLPTVAETASACRAHWERFWSAGGAIDLSGSADPRAAELERRIVLSQYLTAIQCAGSLPPQETGLTFNSWYGKFHLEMHWWHAAHFALWGRAELLERSLGYYDRILPGAQETARRQGYTGARWPKMVGPDGLDSPSPIGPFLIWQQPHPIYYAELLYRLRGDRQTLERYRAIVLETAEFMSSFAVWIESAGCYRLGPPLIPAQETYRAEETWDPTFELEYWSWGLATAQSWRERLGLARDERWDHVLRHLPPLPMAGGMYVNAGSHPHTFTDKSQRNDHPSLLGALGILPGALADRETMRRTLHRVLETWRWQDKTWGWDYPMTAMTAARVGEPGLAVDALLSPNPRNTYLPNGHNYNREGLTIYLPGNGGLLMAAAMMAAGWDGAPEVNAPGFPQDGSWSVRWEELQRVP